MSNLIIKSKIKSFVPEMSVADEVSKALNEKAIELLKNAEKRAKANNRRTILARDI